MKAVTWSRESNGLFDYESPYVTKKILKSQSSAKIVRIKNDVYLVDKVLNEKSFSEKSKTLAYLMHSDGHFKVTRSESGVNPNCHNHPDNLWLVTRSAKDDDDHLGYELKTGDIIKLGRVKFRIKEMLAGENIESNKGAFDYEDIKKEVSKLE
eukprot:CAMPEP_0114583366 /NCGR_PEP_ID=MMETSP0125-20121206/7114_1 /TAXON_ID=485358 ORGANISM="Aristerostoma sp., Strain ATCC 50986" /NCGR_SAMPLE_ID=MMETSP0125 /ASSEMBLY_ACC=CAM_ASM_000245 /LENGTH=152 /DNA_ID=CAMNT_0001776781 /DNA_START=76 /DNA_END=534 /DNA_ORIENTATION=+